MCIIIVKGSGAELKEEWLKNSFDKNDNGAGFALRREGKSGDIILRKGFMEYKKFLKEYIQFVKKEDEAIIHFRIRTSGLTDAENTHPYIISNEYDVLRTTSSDVVKTVMAHNGMLSNVVAKGDLSDTQEFIKLIISDKYILRGLYKSDAIISLIKEFVGYSKLAFLDSKHGIRMVGSFSESNGCFFSNETYKTSKYVYNRNALVDRRYAHPYSGYDYQDRNSLEDDFTMFKKGTKKYALDDSGSWECIEIIGEKKEEESSIPESDKSEDTERVICMLCKEWKDCYEVNDLPLCSVCIKVLKV